MTTTCSKCGKEYDATPEEAKDPGRECFPCWRKSQKWGEEKQAPRVAAGKERTE